MATFPRSGRVLLGLLPLLAVLGCTAAAASAPPTVDPQPIMARAAPTPLPPPPPADVRIAFTEVFGGNVVLWLADAAGLFRKHHLTVTLERQSETAALSALAVGELDVVVGPGGPAISAAAEGTALRFVAGLVNQYPHRFMVGTEIDGPRDLKGTRLGIGRAGSVSEAATRLALRGLRLEVGADVTLLQIGSPAERMAALENGAIQGAAMTPPETLTLERLGFRPLADLAASDVDAPVNQVIVTARLAREDPGRLERLVRALVEATALAKHDRDLAKRVLASYLGTTESAGLDETYDLFVQKLALRAPFPAPLRDVLREMAESNPRVGALDPAVLADRSFVQQVVDGGLLAQLYGDDRPLSARR